MLIRASAVARDGRPQRPRHTPRPAAVVPRRTDADTLQGFVAAHTAHSAVVYTDGERAYESLPCRHESVHHSVGEYVRTRRTRTESSRSGRC